jgi:hypothetical protein
MDTSVLPLTFTWTYGTNSTGAYGVPHIQRANSCFNAFVANVASLHRHLSGHLGPVTPYKSDAHLPPGPLFLDHLLYVHDHRLLSLLEDATGATSRACLHYICASGQ